jgi:hypothetical protein
MGALLKEYTGPLIVAGLVLLWACLLLWNAVNHGKDTQAAKDQKVVTQAVTSGAASKVQNTITKGAVQRLTKRTAKDQATGKDLSHVQTTIAEELAGQDIPTAALPDPVADVYLNGLAQLRYGSSTEPSTLRECSGGDKDGCT